MSLTSRRVDIRAILVDPVKRRELMVGTIIATQAREGIETTRLQAEAAYDKIQAEQRTPVDGATSDLQDYRARA
jgi:hypothetical protein